MTPVLLALVAGVVGNSAPTTPPKTIMSIFIDDLGFYDTQVGLQYNHPNIDDRTFSRLTPAAHGEMYC